MRQISLCPASDQTASVTRLGRGPATIRSQYVDSDFPGCPPGWLLIFIGLQLQSLQFAPGRTSEIYPRSADKDSEEFGELESDYVTVSDVGAVKAVC